MRAQAVASHQAPVPSVRAHADTLGSRSMTLTRAARIDAVEKLAFITHDLALWTLTEHGAALPVGIRTALERVVDALESLRRVVAETPAEPEDVPKGSRARQRTGP